MSLSALRHLPRGLRALRVLARHGVLLPPATHASAPPIVRTAVRMLGGAPAGDPAPAGLSAAMAGLGPSAVKLGQLLATRPDIVGPETALALAGLQDRMPPFGMDQARAALTAAFGAAPEALFARFDPPVAAASIAQVHPAWLPDGRKVAVKVLRPGVEVAFAADLEAMAAGAALAERVSAEGRRLRARAAVATIAGAVQRELDLRLEAAAMSEMAEAVGEDADFRVPAVFWDLTRARVLTTEWIDAIPLTDAAALEAAGIDRAALAVRLIRVFLRQALVFGFFHADLHPGNLFAEPGGRIVAVDYGITGRLDPAMRRFMAETLSGFLTRDYRRVAAVHFDAGFVPARHAREDFAQALRAIGEPIFGRRATDVSMGALLGQLFDTTARFDMALQPQLLLLQKTMVTAEGVARSLDPGLDIWEASRPVVEQWLTAAYGPEGRLREAAEGMGALGRAMAQLPQTIETLERLSATMSPDGLKLHPDTARAIAAAEVQSTRHLRLAVWIGAAALALIALTGG